MYNEHIRKRDKIRRANRNGPDEEYIMPLYRLVISNVPNEKIMDWMALNGLRYSNTLIKRTLKMAAREDLIGYLIKEEEINLGDIVKSRMTARIGKVIKIRPDGDTLYVKWDSGGTQPIPKESVFKLRNKEIDNTSTKDFSHVTTSDGKETYKNVEKPKVFQRESEKIKEQRRCR